jgi:hypothetical protein
MTGAGLEAKVINTTLMKMIVGKFKLHSGDEVVVLGTVRVFRQKPTLEDAIRSHAFVPLGANMRVTNGIPLGSSLSYRFALEIASKHQRFPLQIVWEGSYKARVRCAF